MSQQTNNIEMFFANLVRLSPRNVAKLTFQVYYCRMQILFERNKHSMAELCLLGFFILGLFLAWLIVAEKTRVSYSDLIELRYSGLSASVPQGEGWAGMEQWQYNGQYNLYFLSSELRLNQQPEMYVEWQYLLAEEPGDISDKLKHAVSRLNGVIFEVSRSKIDDLNFAWVKFAQASIDKEGFIAIAELPSGRYLKLFIRTEAQSASLPHIFQHALNSVKFETDELLEESSNFVVYLKSIGVPELVKTSTGNDMENLYTIEKSLPNKQGLALMGYTIERFVDSYTSGPQLGVDAKQVAFFGGVRASLDQSDFSCPKDFTQLKWDTKRQRTNNTNWIQTSIDSDSLGQMTFTKNKESVKYHLSNIVIPEILIEPAARAFLDYDSDAVIVEILASDGRIVPTLLTKTRSEKITEAVYTEQNYEHIVKLNYLHQLTAKEYFFFDSDNFIAEKHYTDSQQYLVYRASSWATILSKFKKDAPMLDKLFPERASNKI